MKGDNMKKTICILVLLFLPLLLGGCGGKAKPMELPEIEVPVIEVESETESESETEFVFSDMTVYHGILVTESDLGYASGPFRREEATKLKETLLCTSYQEYREYIEMVKLTWPDADVYKFPDIPAEWFEEWSLLTLLLVGNNIGGGFSLEESWTDGEKLLLTLKAETKGIEMEDWLIYDRGTFLTAIPKEQAEKLEIIDYIVLFDGQEEKK